jgi:dihydroorotase-like cyclic amidohydrolase
MTSNAQQLPDELGPVDYLVVEFPGNQMTGEGFPILVDLVDRGIINVLDLVFVTKDADGNVARIELDALDGIAEVEVFEGASSGLLGDEDLAEVSEALEPNSSAALIVYENSWAGPLGAALRRGGGRLVAFGRIPTQELIAAVDALDAKAGL